MKSSISTSTMVPILVVLLVSLFCLTLLPSSSLGQKKDQVILRLAWVVFGIDSPFFVALDKGYYDQENIALKIAEGRGSSVTVQAVGSGQTTFGIADYTVMAILISKGLPVKGVAGIMQRSPAGFMSLSNTKLKDPKDLIGKKIGIAAGGTQMMLLDSFLGATKVNKKDLLLIHAGGAARYAALLERKMDVIAGYVPSGVPVVEAAGHKVNVMYYSDYGASAMSNGLIASTKLISENPNLVRRFVKASLKGWKYSMDHPEEAVQILIKRFPSKKDRKKAWLRELSLYLPFLHTENTKGKPLGWMAREDWLNTLAILRKHGKLKEELPLERHYTNEFIPG